MAKKTKLPKLGSGKRFEYARKKLAAKEEVRDPDAVIAARGRKKYGKKRFQQLAAKGRKKKS